MSAADRGRLLFEYKPPRAHPIIYAGLMVFAFVFVTGSLEVWWRGTDASVLAWYMLPLGATLAVFLAGWPTPTRIYEGGIAPSRNAWTRWRGSFLRWEELDAVYPSFYDVTGAFVSPFASSDGKVTQMGLALERDGHAQTVRFTPTRFSMWESRSAGYEGALAAVRHAWGDRPLVADSPTFTKAEADAMIEEAGKPFLPFFAIVLLFASAAPVLWILTRLGLGVAPSLAISLIAPVAVSLRSAMQSKRRHQILDRLSKAAEFERGQAASADAGEEAE